MTEGEVGLNVNESTRDAPEDLQERYIKPHDPYNMIEENKIDWTFPFSTIHTYGDSHFFPKKFTEHEYPGKWDPDYGWTSDKWPEEQCVSFTENACSSSLTRLAEVLWLFIFYNFKFDSIDWGDCDETEEDIESDDSQDEDYVPRICVRYVTIILILIASWCYTR